MAQWINGLNDTPFPLRFGRFRFITPTNWHIPSVEDIHLLDPALLKYSLSSRIWWPKSFFNTRVTLPDSFSHLLRIQNGLLRTPLHPESPPYRSSRLFSRFISGQFFNTPSKKRMPAHLVLTFNSSATYPCHPSLGFFLLNHPLPKHPLSTLISSPSS
jgi:hypothetical protein